MRLNLFRRNTLNKTWDFIVVGAGSAGCMFLDNDFAQGYRGAQGCGCLHHAGNHLRQYQCAGGDDCRKGE